MSSRYSRLLGVGYFIAAVLVLFPVIDLVANLWPIQPGRINWRYGAYMLSSGFVLTMILGMGVALLIARAGRHRRTARLLAGLNGVLGIVLAAAAIVFLLDVVQLRAGVTGDARGQFDIGAVKSLVKNAIAAVGFLWIGWIGWRRDPAMKSPRRVGGRETVVAKPGAPDGVG